MQKLFGMNSKQCFALLASLCLCLMAGCKRPALETQAPMIAVSTSYLEAAARDLLGENLQIMRLSEPGACPGHFDIRPSQVLEGRKCRVLLRFDFQKSLDDKFGSSSNEQPKIIAISIPGGMCVPSSYLAACGQIAKQLVACNMLSQTEAENRLKIVSQRLDAWSNQATNRIKEAGLFQLPVLASTHQQVFCEWLGLKVVATLRSADLASISEIESAIKKGDLASVRLVIANLPEGRRTADALAERLNARTVVFGNFPSLKEGRLSFEHLISGNLDALAQAVPR
jgi:zinc transport system substrate-binding protein